MQENVSVVIPAYNCAEYLGRAVQSVVQGVLLPKEIVVVDDGSTDATAAVVRAMPGMVRYVGQQNLGPAAARNRGIRESTGEWIAFLDSDDEWLPNRLAAQLELVAQHPGIGWCSGAFEVWREHRRSRVRGQLLSSKGAPVRVHPSLDLLAAGIPLWTGTILARRETLVRLEGFDGSLKGPEDTDMWFRLARELPLIGYIEAPIARYHVRVADNLTARAAAKTSIGVLEFVRKAIRELPYWPEADHPKVRTVLSGKLRMAANLSFREGSKDVGLAYLQEAGRLGLEIATPRMRLMARMPARILRFSSAVRKRFSRWFYRQT